MLHPLRPGTVRSVRVALRIAFVFVVVALLAPSAHAQARWQACVTISSVKTYALGPGYWTDGIGAFLAPSFSGTEVLAGPGTLCTITLIVSVPEDYHTSSELITVNIGPGQGFAFTEFGYDLFFNPCDWPIVMPIYVGNQNGGTTQLQIVGEYFVDLADPDVEFTVNGMLEYAGPLSGLVPGTIGLAEVGELVLTPCCLADVDCDGEIGFADLIAILSAWGDTNCMGEEGEKLLCEGDLDGDGIVGLSDVLAALTSWGPCDDPCGS